MSTVIAVAGTIAGAGTTTVVTALGTALGEQRRRVALVDATEEGSRIADAIDVDGEGELADALRRGTTPTDVQATGPHDVAAFPADPTTNWGAVRPDAVDTFYESLRERFEFVLIDCGCSMSPARSPWLGHADEVAIVTDPDVAGAVSEPASLSSVFDVPIRGVIANRVPHKEVDDALEAMESVDAPVLGVLPEDATVGAAAESGSSVLRAEPDSPIATCVWKLALRVRETDHDEPVIPPGAAARSNRAAGQETGPEMGEGASGEDDGDPAPGTSEDETTTADDDVAPSTASETGVGDAIEPSDDETTDASSPAEAGFETPDPQPVEPAPDDATPVEPTADPEEPGTEDRGVAEADGDESDADETEMSEPSGDEAEPSATSDGDQNEKGDDEEEESAALSDDEIEAVFQETMQRVKERQETDTDE